MKTDNKIQSLNYAIREAIPAMCEAAEQNPQAQVIVRAIKFSSGAQWHIADQTPLDRLQWSNIEAENEKENGREETDMGAAFSLLVEELRTFPTAGRYLPPVLVLITDGEPTDNWRDPLRELLSVPWAQHARRLAVPVGKEAKLEPLVIDNPEIRTVRADDPDQLVQLSRIGGWPS